jgi:anti-sigma factor RsiW
MRDSPPHKLDELVAYVYGEGTPGERAAFEAHLGDCPDCRADVERLRRLLPYAHAQLRKPLDTSVDGMMRLMEAAERELQATRAEKDASRARRRPWILAGATLALAAAAAAVFLLVHPVKKPRDDVAAPRRNIDGG